MAIAMLKGKSGRTYLGDYLVDYCGDEECEGLNWEVYDGDMDFVDAYATEAEAIAYATELAEAAEAEDIEDRKQELRDQIADLAGDCEDLALLERVRNMLDK